MRLDQALVAEGLADSRSRAQALIADGLVAVDGVVIRKPAQKVTGQITLLGAGLEWVSRAALKLVAALDHFDLSPDGAVALDLGASTGGFTQVLLARGAAQVYAVDVGHGQLHGRVAADARVINLERTHARDLPDDLPPVNWVVSDLSFISLRKALGPALAVAANGAVLVALVKPQFEVGPRGVGKGGIVRDAALRQQALADCQAFVEQAGWQVLGAIESPVPGSDGNQEFLLAARK